MASGKQHPNGSSSTYTYDKAGNVTAYTSPDAGTVKTEYTPHGQIKRRTVATGRVTEYGYDAVGNITRIKGVSESSYYQNYQYDDLSRLTNASGMSTEHNSDGGDVFSSYSMGMEYNIMSSPLLYDLTITTTSGTKFTKNAYLYLTYVR